LKDFRGGPNRQTSRNKRKVLEAGIRRLERHGVSWFEKIEKLPPKNGGQWERKTKTTEEVL